jgi:BCD family chlorophyll transporter-like MFS transporter
LSLSTPGLSLPATLRLGLFQGCLGALAVIFSGMFNGVMLSELAFPGVLVGGALAFEQFVAPARVLFGQISDSRPLAGRHRVPYVLMGTLLFCSLAVASVPLIFLVGRLLAEGLQPQLGLGIAALCGLFALYGLAVSMASTPFLALVIDRSTEQERPRAVGIIWCMLTVGIIIGAIAIRISLQRLDGIDDPAVLEPVLFRFMIGVAVIVLTLTLLATWGMEPRSSAGVGCTSAVGSPQLTPREDQISLLQAWRLITSSRQVLVFFSFLMLFTLGLFLQDPILEGYGGQVFGMAIGARTQLNAYWGSGTLIGLLLAGFWIGPQLGKLGCTRLGCRLIVLSLLLLVLTGLTASVTLLSLVMVMFGLAAGIGTNGALSLMLDLTLPRMAGTFVGVWGLAQAMSRALGKLLGGGLLDLGRRLPFGEGDFPAYALVLLVEALVAALALLLLERINIRQFRQDTGRSLGQVLSMEVGG